MEMIVIITIGYEWFNTLEKEDSETLHNSQQLKHQSGETKTMEKTHRSGSTAVTYVHGNISREYI